MIIMIRLTEECTNSDWNRERRERIVANRKSYPIESFRHLI